MSCPTKEEKYQHRYNTTLTSPVMPISTASRVIPPDNIQTKSKKLIMIRVKVIKSRDVTRLTLINERTN